MDSEKENEPQTFHKITIEEARKLLDVGPQVTRHDVKSAYKRKAMDIYPRELINPPETMSAFRQISIAYRRLAYDSQVKDDQIELPEEHEFKTFREMFEDERHVVHVHTEHGSFLVLGKRYSLRRTSKDTNDDDFDASHYSFQKPAVGADEAADSAPKTKADKKKLKKQRQRENKRQAKENLQKQREEIKQERQKIAEELKADQPNKEDSNTVKDATNVTPTQPKEDVTEPKESIQSGKATETANKGKDAKGKSGQKKNKGTRERANSKDSAAKAQKEITEESKVERQDSKLQTGGKEGSKELDKNPGRKKMNNLHKTSKQDEARKSKSKSAPKISSGLKSNVKKPKESDPVAEKEKDLKVSHSDSDDEMPDTGDIDVECAFFAKSVKTVQKNASGVKGNGKAAGNDSLKKDPADGNATQKFVDEKSKHDPTAEIVHQFAIEANSKAGQGKFGEAASLFTRAILLDATNFLLYANRSFCYEQLSEFEKALRDAERSISFSPQWSKGYFRKGRALVGLKRFKDAEKAFEQVLRLDKTNHDADNELYHARVKRLEEIGFSKQQSVLAIRKYITVDEALEKMLTGGLSEAAVEDVYVSDDEDLIAPVPELAALSLRSNYGEPSDIPENMTSQNGAGGYEQSETNSYTRTPLDEPLDARTANPMFLCDVSPPQHSERIQRNVPPALVDNHGKNQKKEQYLAVWIGNITRKITETILNDYFTKFGPIRCIRMHYDKQFAFVNYINPESASLTLETHSELDLHGHHLILSFPGHRYTPNRIHESILNKRSTQYDYDAQRHDGRMYPRGGDVPPRHSQPRPKPPVHDTRRECIYWRRDGCIHGPDCKYLHVPEHQGIDSM